MLPASAAPKTDIVYFKNGDMLTGDVKSLRRGRLSLNTDATGTISIEWHKIAGIVSNQDIQVETASGIRYFGHFATSKESSEIVVVTSNGPQAIDAAGSLSWSPSVAEAEDTDSAEATFSAKWDWFLFQDPELDWSTTLQLIPSLTESGRVRGEIDTDLKWELVNDLKWGITFTPVSTISRKPRPDRHPIMVSTRH